MDTNDERRQTIIKNLPWFYLIPGLGLMWGSFRVYLTTLSTESTTPQYAYLFDISPRIGAVIAFLLGLGLLVCFFGLKTKKGWARQTAIWIGLINILWILSNSYQNLFIKGSVTLGIAYLLGVFLLTYGTYFLLRRHPQ